jgi:uncharacterized membrane protein
MSGESARLETALASPAALFHWRTGKLRNPFLDSVRGAALVAMFAYHLTWDLAFLGFIDEDVPLSPFLKAYAHGVAWTFLALVGVSLVLATRAGFRPRPFLRRLAVVATAAAAITLATFLLFPRDFIFFGILHCIAVSSVLALPFLTAPVWLAAAAAAAFVFAPIFIALPIFDAPPMWWVGLGTRVPPTVDYAPLVPGFGMVLIGVVFGRLVQLSGAAGRPISGWVRPFAWGGRHSLLVYLVHQPIFLGLLYVVALATGTHARTGHDVFLDACRSNCLKAAPAAICERACLCSATRLEASPLWPKVFAEHISPSDRDSILAIETRCATEGPGQ